MDCFFYLLSNFLIWCCVAVMFGLRPWRSLKHTGEAGINYMLFYARKSIKFEDLVDVVVENEILEVFTNLNADAVN